MSNEWRRSGDWPCIKDTQYIHLVNWRLYHSRCRPLQFTPFSKINLSFWPRFELWHFHLCEFTMSLLFSLSTKKKIVSFVSSPSATTPSNQNFQQIKGGIILIQCSGNYHTNTASIGAKKWFSLQQWKLRSYKGDIRDSDIKRCVEIDRDFH